MENITKIKDTLLKKHKEVIFIEDTHKYTKKGKELTPVSNTLEYFNKEYANVPWDKMQPYIDFGNEVHKILENIVNKVLAIEQKDKIKMEKILIKISEKIKQNDKLSIKHKEHILVGVSAIKGLIKRGFIPLITELIVSDTKLAGTIDLLLFRENKESIDLMILDWKTGSIKIQAYAQVSLYEFLLNKELNRLIKANNMKVYFYNNIFSTKERKIAKGVK